MIYKASESLTELILKVKKNLIVNFGWCVLIVLIYTPIIYHEFGTTKIWLFIPMEFFILLLAVIIDRTRTVSTSKNINKLAIEVQILDESLVIKTAPIKVLFWVNKPSVELKFIKHEFSRNKVLYPVKSIYNLDNKVWKLNAGNDEVFILTDFYDLEFAEELEKFLYWKDAAPAHRY